MYGILVRAMRVGAAAWVTLVCSGLSLGAVPGESGAVDLSAEEFAGRLAWVVERLTAEEGALGPEGESLPETAFPDGTRVRDGDGRSIRLDRETLLHWTRQARESPEGRAPLLIHLRALEAQLRLRGSGPGGGDSDWAERLAMLEPVYDAPEFRYLRDSREWTRAIGEMIRAILEWLTSHLEGVGPGPRRWIQITVYGVILVSGLLFILGVLRSSRAVGWKRRSPLAMGSGRRIPPGERDWAWWHREAGVQAGKGAYREAVRCLFIAVLMKGQDHGWWTYETQSTNREHLARTGGPPARREALGRLVEMYERTWYGLSEAGEGEFREFQSWARRVEQAA